MDLDKWHLPIITERMNSSFYFKDLSHLPTNSNWTFAMIESNFGFPKHDHLNSNTLLPQVHRRLVIMTISKSSACPDGCICQTPCTFSCPDFHNPSSSKKLGDSKQILLVSSSQIILASCSFNLILERSRYYYCPHFVDNRIEGKRLGYSPRIPQLLCGRCHTCNDSEDLGCQAR